MNIIGLLQDFSSINFQGKIFVTLRRMGPFWRNICKNYTGFLVEKAKSGSGSGTGSDLATSPGSDRIRIRNTAAHLFEAAERSVPVLPPLILQEYTVSLPAPTGPALSFYGYNYTRITGPALSIFFAAHTLKGAQAWDIPDRVNYTEVSHLDRWLGD